MHPEAQVNAFEEINRVIGQDRLPTLADREKLPYMEALWKETLRWSPPFPTSESKMYRFHYRVVTSITF